MSIAINFIPYYDKCLKGVYLYRVKVYQSSVHSKLSRNSRKHFTKCTIFLTHLNEAISAGFRVTQIFILFTFGDLNLFISIINLFR